MYSFIVFKYVNLILWNEFYILGRIGLHLGDLGRGWINFKDLGSKGKIFLGSWGNFFQGFGEINALFSGIKGAQTPSPLGASDLINVICGKNFCQGHWRNCSNFCIKYINVCQESIKLFLFLLRDIISHWPWKFIKSIIHKTTCHTCIYYTLWMRKHMAKWHWGR